MLKHMGFYHSHKNIKKNLSDTGLDVVKTASKNIVLKTGEFLGHKIADAVTKSNDDEIVKQGSVKEIIITPEKID